MNGFEKLKNFKRIARPEDCAVSRSSRRKDVVMEVVNVHGEVIGTLKNGGEERKPPYQEIVERASL